MYVRMYVPNKNFIRSQYYGFIGVTNQICVEEVAPLFFFNFYKTKTHIFYKIHVQPEC